MQQTSTSVTPVLAADPTRCVTCGTALQGPYCHACGEMAPTAHDPRLVTFLRHVASGAFDLDSRLWRSFRLLLTRPGELTAEFIRGRWQPYLGPMQVFLIANVIFFAVLSTVGGFGTFTTRLEYHRLSAYGAAVERLTAQYGEAGSAGAEEYRQRFNEATPRYANSMVILMVPLMALVLKLLSPRRYYAYHLVFALHFMAFLLIMNTALPFLLRGVMALRPAARSMVNAELPISIVILSILTTYLALAWRLAYGGSGALAGLRAAAAVLLFIPVLTTYRMLLFFAVYLAL